MSKIAQIDVPVPESVIDNPEYQGLAKEISPPRRTPFDTVMHLQRTLGNRAVGRLIQAKFAVSQRGDEDEQEADRVAGEVVSVHNNELIGGSRIPEFLRNGDVDEANGFRLSEESSIQSPVESLAGDGRPLSKSVRTMFEPAFGRDFSDVRIHTGSQSAGIAKQLNAKAFTTGKNVVFGAGQYAPGNPTGQKLLAHELTHVVQQSQRIRPLLQRQEESPEQKELVLFGKPISYWRKVLARKGLPKRVLKYLDKPVSFTGKRPLTATIRSEGIQIAFDDGGQLYIDRSRSPLDAYLLEKEYKAEQERRKRKEKWWQTLVRWLGPSPSVESVVKSRANWELSDRLWIIQKIADGWTVQAVMAKLRSLNISNFQVIAISASIVPFFAGMGLFPGSGGAKPPVRGTARGVAGRALERAGMRRMSQSATRRFLDLKALRSQAQTELLKARARGGPVTLNIGGKGEVKDAINVNSNISSVEKAPGWQNWVNANGEQIGQIFPGNSVDKIVSNNLPPSLNWTALANGAKSVLKPGGTVSLHIRGSAPIVAEAFKKAGFKSVKFIGDVLVIATK